jgi:hypothetical protein
MSHAIFRILCSLPDKRLLKNKLYRETDEIEKSAVSCNIHYL